MSADSTHHLVMEVTLYGDGWYVDRLTATEIADGFLAPLYRPDREFSLDDAHWSADSTHQTAPAATAPYAQTRLDALRQLRREGYAVVDKDRASLPALLDTLSVADHLNEVATSVLWVFGSGAVAQERVNALERLTKAVRAYDKATAARRAADALAALKETQG